MDKEQHYFYVVLCQDNSLYAGYTNALHDRIETHNQGKGAKYTRPASRRPVRLIYAEVFSDKSLAMQQEYWFKQLTRSKKLAYLESRGRSSIEGLGLVIVNRQEEEQRHADTDEFSRS